MALLGSSISAADPIWRLSASGRIFIASDADENDLVTGQTSFVATTPTFLLAIPSGTVCLPLFVNLSQTGTVAGGPIDVISYMDNTNRYSSGGTSELVFNPNSRSETTNGVAGPRVNVCTLYSNPTAAAGVGARIFGATIGQDVSPAEGGVPGPFWRAELPYMLTGPASFLVFTYAGTTGPTWFWSIGWAEWPTTTVI